MKLQSELDFIQHLDVDLKAVLRRPQWLFSDFDAPVWEVSLEYKKPFPIDWQVMIGDHLLTAPQNKELFESFRYFLVCSVDGTNGQSKTSIDEKRKSFSEALTIIDYFIMHADTLELEACGLSGITASNLSTLLYQYSTHPFSSESIYEYTKQAAVHITAITAETDPKHIARVMVRYPSIEDLRDGDDSAPPEFLDSSLVPYIRAALFSHGYYRGSPGEGFHLNGKTISDLIYKGTLAGSRIKPRLHWMSFFPYEQSYTRELPMVPVRFSGNGVISEPNLRSFRSTLYRLGALHRLNLTAPQPHDLESILKLEIPTADDKCYRSVPSKIILDQFKNCVEFHFKYGRIIIDGFCRVAAYSKANSVPMHQIGDQTLQKIIGPELLKLGVKTLGLSCKRLKKNKNKPPKTEYYAKLRQNEGLIELVQIYIGCAQFVTGTLMARRHRELSGLPLQKCLDVTKEWLILDLEKTSKGLHGVRDTEGRPIDPLPVAMIRMLTRMQRLLKRFNFIDEYKPLFATPSTLGYRGLIQWDEGWNRNIDIMSDYFQTPFDKNGHRYYIRQHQLRRFFALMFFHTYGTGGLNAIRWMLGHRDIEHVYRYIRSIVDAPSLRGALTQFALEDMAKGRLENYEVLADLLESKFGTATYGLYDEVEADIYIQSRVKNGDVIIEPVFFTDENGQQMQVIVRATNKGH